MSGDQKADATLDQLTRAIRDEVTRHPGSASPEAADEFIRAFVTTTPPRFWYSHWILNRAVDVVSALIPIETSRVLIDGVVSVFPDWLGKKGRSTKPGNLLLNLRKAFLNINDNGLKLAGLFAVAQHPIGAVLAILSVAAKIYGEAQIDIGEKEAFVMWGIWRGRDEKYTVEKAAVLRVVNQEAASLMRPPLSQLEVEGALKTLEELKCIETAAGAPDRFYLRETVVATYR